MKTLISIIILILFAFNLIAQVPQKMSYQAVVRTNSNALIVSKVVGMQISILQGTANGLAVYVETQTPTTNANGLASFEIGTGTIIKGTFTAIDWASGTYFVKIETDPNGGSAYSISGTSQLTSVPYALYSANGTPGPQGPKGETGGYQKHFIGEEYGGGIVFYVYDDGQHGLIASKESLGGWPWQIGPKKLTGATGDGLGAGFMNTILIIAASIGENPNEIYAAKVCADYIIIENGTSYGDWYLPSRYELRLLINQRNIFSGSDAIHLELNHWSSTEVLIPVGGAWNILGDHDFVEGTYTGDYVRPIRSF
jgi:hypothetical protein